MLFFFLVLQVLYALFTIVMWIAWHKTPTFHYQFGIESGTQISVIIVVRNEENNLPTLLDSLSHQTYPAHLFRVYIVDDFSTDATTSLVTQYQSKVPFGLHLLQLENYYKGKEPGNTSFKKKGIEWAVNESTGELIVTTDGDCIVPQNWLKTIAAFYEQTNAQMICGLVSFIVDSNAIFAKMQTVEFASLIGSGAATLYFGIPTMCNAANLAFTKQAFHQVSGYKDTATTATGDDLFLMHKIYKAYPDQVKFLKNPESIVLTHPQATFSDFYQQRKRWASKWHLYSDWRVSAFAVFIFLCNLSLIVIIPAAYFSKAPFVLCLSIVLFRWISEWLFLGQILLFQNQRRFIHWILPVQFIYPLYVIFFGVIVQKKGYSWKGRKLY